MIFEQWHPIFFLSVLTPAPLLFWAYVLPFVYWCYLILTTNFVVVFDSEGYINLANMFYHTSQWAQYFRTGPNREPLYPLLIALSMHIGDWLNISYAYILKILSFLCLATTMFFIQRSLKKDQCRPPGTSCRRALYRVVSSIDQFRLVRIFRNFKPSLSLSLLYTLAGFLPTQCARKITVLTALLGRWPRRYWALLLSKELAKGFSHCSFCF